MVCAAEQVDELGISAADDIALRNEPSRGEGRKSVVEGTSVDGGAARGGHVTGVQTCALPTCGADHDQTERMRAYLSFLVTGQPVTSEDKYARMRSVWSWSAPPSR